MNLKDALLCINCDEVFTIGESPSNPTCPRCTSSAFAPLSAWVQTCTAFENSQGETIRITWRASTKRPRMEIINSTFFDA